MKSVIELDSILMNNDGGVFAPMKYGGWRPLAQGRGKNRTIKKFNKKSYKKSYKKSLKKNRIKKNYKYTRKRKLVKLGKLNKTFFN